jgi:hypothetical protein
MDNDASVLSVVRQEEMTGRCIAAFIFILGTSKVQGRLVYPEIKR